MLSLKSKIKISSKRLVLLLGALVLITTPIFGLLQSDTAYAAKDYKSLSPDKKYEFFMYAKRLGDCFDNTNYNIHTSGERISNGELFNREWQMFEVVKHTVSNYAPFIHGKKHSEGYKLECSGDDNQFAKAALAELGISGVDLLCNMGFSRGGSRTISDCISNGGDFNRHKEGQRKSEDFYKALKTLTKNTFDFHKESRTNLIQYPMWRDVLIYGCTTINPIPENTYNGLDKKNRLLTKGVEDEKTVTVRYEKNKTGTEPSVFAKYAPKSPDFRCDTLASKVGSFADGYIGEFYESVAPSLCEGHGYNKDEQRACENGVKNKTNARFCERQYNKKGSEKQLNACLHGLDLANQVVINDTNAEEDGDTKDCGTEMEGIGYIVCPVLNAAVAFADGVYRLFESFLVVNPMQSGDGDTYFKAWTSMRNIANSVIIVVFLMIIFSQVSNIGISNYGIKRMLPRLVTAAILINISYFIMQIAVDLINVFGSGIGQLFANIAPQYYDSPATFASILISIIGAGGLTVGAAVGGAAAISIVSAPVALLFLLLLLAPAIIGIVAGFVALSVRAALIPILAVLAPIAIAAWILPNTQSLFDRWRKILSSLLFMYPIAALYYSGLKFATGIVLSSSNSGVLEQMLALGTLFIGTFAVLIIAIRSNSIVNGIIKTATSAINTVTKPLIGMGQGYVGGKAAMNYQRFSQQDPKKLPHTNRHRFNPLRYISRSTAQGAVLKYGQSKWAREQGAAIMKGDTEQARQAWAQAGSSEFAKMAGIDVDGSPTARAYMNTLTEKAVKNEEANISTHSIDQLASVLKSSLESGDEIKALAAQNMLLRQGSSGLSAFNDVIENKAGATMSESVQSSLATNLRSAHAGVMDKDNVTKTWATETGPTGAPTTYAEAESKAMNKIATKGITPEKFAAMSDDAQNRLLKNDSARAGLSQEVLQVLGNPSTQAGSKVSNANRKIIHEELNIRGSSTSGTGGGSSGGGTAGGSSTGSGPSTPPPATGGTGSTSTPPQNQQQQAPPPNQQQQSPQRGVAKTDGGTEIPVDILPSGISVPAGSYVKIDRTKD